MTAATTPAGSAPSTPAGSAPSTDAVGSATVDTATVPPISGDATASVVSGSGGVVTTALNIGPIEAEAASAVQGGLAAAHAAIWTYGLISAYDPDDIGTIRAARQGNTQIRNAATDLLRTAGVEPVRTEAAYAVPVAVTDRPTALQLAIVVEKDCTNAWRAVVGTTDNLQLRSYALSALSDAAVRLTGWRVLAGVAPATVPFPGNETA